MYYVRMNPIPRIFQSSVDPTKVSLFITSASKALAGIVVTLLTLKGIDPAIATQNVQTVTEAATNIVAQYAAIVPAVYAAYHSAEAIYGVLRKVAVRVFAKGPITSSAAAPSIAIVAPTE